MTFKKSRKKIDRYLSKSVLKVNKKQRFVVTTIIATILLMLTQFFNIPEIFFIFFLTAIIVYIFSIWCLWEDLEGVEFFTLILLPVIFTLAISFFYLLLPNRIIFRIPVLLFYSIGIYAILSLENIFNIAVIRTIGLLRAAKTFNLIFSLFSIFFLFNTIFTLHLSIISNLIIISILSFLISLPVLWSEKLSLHLEKSIIFYSLIISLVISQLMVFISFYPLNPTFASLYLTTQFYILFCVVQYKINESPVKKSVLEYAVLTVLSLILIFTSSAWII